MVPLENDGFSRDADNGWLFGIFTTTLMRASGAREPPPNSLTVLNGVSSDVSTLAEAGQAVSFQFGYLPLQAVGRCLHIAKT